MGKTVDHCAWPGDGDNHSLSLKAWCHYAILGALCCCNCTSTFPWWLSCPYWTHIMHHGEDSTVSYMVWLHQGQAEQQWMSWVQLQQQNCTENHSGLEQCFSNYLMWRTGSFFFQCARDQQAKQACLLLSFLSFLENIHVLANDGLRTVTGTSTTLWVALV